jgi:hypothetical protein
VRDKNNKKRGEARGDRKVTTGKKKRIHIYII